MKSHRPVIQLGSQVYETGVKLSQKVMMKLKKKFQRLPGLEKWFFEIPVGSM
ncbi:MAG: hypothetical protein QNJ55_00720 [Xenococcus sp. MO_188.B8]|nr:hypothetical protein [Xenococcus sp. MO_188.B8]